MEPQNTLQRKITGCAPTTNLPKCLNEYEIEILEKVANVTNENDLLNKSGCKTLECVVNKLNKNIPLDDYKKMKSKFKVDGPRTTALLNNSNIDETLQNWAIYKLNFFAYNFHMLDFHKYSFHKGRVLETPDTLVTLPVKELYLNSNKLYENFACVINTDRYHGGGKHWMALFVDIPNKSIEFFNSSGRNPSAEWVMWMEKTREDLQSVFENTLFECYNVCQIKHQRSKTECGLYSLFYIWARLHGITVDHINTHPIPDKLMYIWRFHLFRDEKMQYNPEIFNLEEYKKYTATPME